MALSDKLAVSWSWGSKCYTLINKGGFYQCWTDSFQHESRANDFVDAGNWFEKESPQSKEKRK